MDIPKKPIPAVNTWAKPFWEAAKEERLIIQKCNECDKYIFYPRYVCPFCSNDDLEWVAASGKGTIYSYSVVESNAPSAFIDDMPYVVAIIRLEEGVQLMSNIIGCDPKDVQCDLPVEVTFEKLDNDFTLPKFKLVE